MASSSLTVELDGKVLRKYGGVRSEVRQLKYYYENMSYKNFLLYHPSVTLEEFKRVKVYSKFNKS